MTASEQSAGRGRQGRRWSAPAGCALLMSLVLRWQPGWGPPALLPLLAGVAVCDAVGGDALVKWPNDVVVAAPDGSLGKLAGILTEARVQEGWAVLGIGVNVAVRLEDLPPELRADAGAGGTRQAATLGLDRSQVEPTLQRLLAALAERLNEPAHATLDAWRKRDALDGRTISWAAGRGTAEGIDGLGRLVVALAAGGHTSLSSGEVHIDSVA